MIGGKPEEIIFFGDQLGGAAADLAIGWLGRVADVEIVVDAVAAFVFAFVDGFWSEALGAANQILHGNSVVRRGGADEIGVADAEEFPKLKEYFLVAVNQFGGRDSLLFGGAFDIDAVLVGAREVRDFVAAHALVARDYVADDGRIGRADVRARVRVVDGSGEIEFLGLIHEIWALLARLLELESLTHRNARERFYSGGAGCQMDGV